ncbi:methyltransferase, FkbM family [SAR116 cluster alpha proteobacterium HIMB100]|nr:methyltransferase, FkbM family [SAR116 cluster alpha proteobacterium HIMB100]
MLKFKPYIQNQLNSILRHYASTQRKKHRFSLDAENIVCFGFEPSADLLGFHGGPERREFDFSISYLKQKGYDFDTALDVGANIGLVSVYLSKYYNSVYSFEPHPSNFKLLQLNAAYCFRKNISPFHIAISENSKMVELFDWDPYQAAKARLNPLPVQLKKHNSSKFRVKGLKIQAISIDEFVEANIKSKVSLLKIDIEGHEIQALKGAVKTIEAHSPAIICEDWDSKKGQPSELRNFLRELGYTKFLSLKQKPDNLIDKPGFFPKIINWPSKLIYVLLFGSSFHFEEDTASGNNGSEHLLALK